MLHSGALLRLAVAIGALSMVMPPRIAVAATDVAPLPGDAASGQFSQALALEHGEGVARDFGKAVALYCEAARAGHALAALHLGWMYANGRGVMRDDALASHLLLRASAGGAAPPQALLARLGPASDEPPECLKPAPVVDGPASEPAPKMPTAPLEPPALARAPAQVASLVEQLAPQFKIDPRLALLIIQLESNFDAKAVSPRNARGLMQLVPDTAARFGVRDVFDPRQNIRGGLAYLRWLLAYFEGDLGLVAAAYNAGEGNVERHLGVPPFPETRRYVQRVLHGFGRTTHGFERSVTARSGQLDAIRARAR